MDLKSKIETVWNDRALLKDEAYSNAVREVIEEVDKGRLRVAEPSGTEWIVNEWVKQAILMYFAIQPMQTWEIAPFEFHLIMKFKRTHFNCFHLLNREVQDNRFFYPKKHHI